MLVNSDSTNFHFSEIERIEILTEIRYALMLIMENRDHEVIEKFPKLLEFKSYLDRCH